MGNAAPRLTANALPITLDDLQKEFGSLFDRPSEIKDVTRLDLKTLSRDSICLVINSVHFKCVKPPVNPTMITGGSPIQTEPRDLQLWDVDCGEVNIGETKVFRAGETLFAVKRMGYKDVTITGPNKLFLCMTTPYLTTVNFFPFGPDGDGSIAVTSVNTGNQEQMLRIAAAERFLGPPTRYHDEEMKEKAAKMLSDPKEIKSSKSKTKDSREPIKSQDKQKKRRPIKSERNSKAKSRGDQPSHSRGRIKK